MRIKSQHYALERTGRRTLRSNGSPLELAGVLEQLAHEYVRDQPLADVYAGERVRIVIFQPRLDRRTLVRLTFSGHHLRRDDTR